MEILILPILVFLFVIIVIVLFNRRSIYKQKVDKSWNALQIQLKKQNNIPADQNKISPDPGLENARHEYNKIVSQYNKIIQKFPTSFMANMAGYEARELEREGSGF